MIWFWIQTPTHKYGPYCQRCAKIRKGLQWYNMIGLIIRRREGYCVMCSTSDAQGRNAA